MRIQTPDWVKHAVFYQIFPDRFAQTRRRPKPVSMRVPLEPWEAPPTLQGYKGGDLWGIVEHLDYLQSLGVTAIYLTPIFQSTCNHRYHTHDYYQVDPLLGGNEALTSLLDAAHARGMRVVLDGVFNHASRGFFYFNDILENGPHSPWLDWFLIEQWPLSAYDGSLPANYTSWVDNRALPKFNHHNAEAREYIMQVGEYWVRQGIDGWRLDVPGEVDVPGFWEEFRDRVKAINPEAYIVGEIWTDARKWLDGTQFDGVMNYLFTGPTIAFTAGDRVIVRHAEEPPYDPYPALDAAVYAHKIKTLLDLYPWEIQLTQFNLISSHDVARVLTVVGAEEASMQTREDAYISTKLAAVLLMTFPGAPSIYYGDEVGVAGGRDPANRRVFPAEADWNQDMLAFYKQLIQLRHQHPALRIGSYRVVYAEGLTYVFARCLDDEVMLVGINASEDDIALQLDVRALPFTQHPQTFLYGEGSVSWSGDRLQLSLPKRSGAIIG
ncbi:MAG: glycoside hydrolase family 13 protein [Leptolyngbyaceae bacterium]|nr:glycoside hydrolase family 13 protein [Leptolyngbyaceae bacterium]